MGQQIIVRVLKSDAVISDLTALNDELVAETYVHELVEGAERFADFKGFIAKNGSSFVMWNREDETYQSDAEVWSCFHRREMAVVSQYITSGSIVFFFEIEGNWPEYWRVSPNKIEEIDIVALL